ADVLPAERHTGRYRDQGITPPPTMAAPDRAQNLPRWTRDQRNSWHGVDFPYHSRLDVWEYYRRYLETLLGVDDSVGRVVDLLRHRGLLENTLILYMGDNGFAFGEHGLIDKRQAYEESMRIPMLMLAPGVPGGTVVDEVVANIDVASTMLDAAALRPPSGLDGRSMLPLLRDDDTLWRTELLYEYFWEHNFPQTPTVHALRGDRYKYIRYHGIWDLDELYDLRDDPHETRNLIASPEHREIAAEMNRRLFEILEETDGMSIPLSPDRGRKQNLRRPDLAVPAPFPPPLIAPE
ncbi:MAG: sulfatase/phosphatase domain-containing protein, partial [Vicinamibacteria bacterium]